MSSEMGGLLTHGGDGLFKEVNGLVWPRSDEHCLAVTFGQVGDISVALPFVKNRMVVVQAGGNAGVWPLALAKIFERVITFEPEPVNYECLQFNTRKKNNIIAWNAALGDSSLRMVHMDYPEGQSNMGAARILLDGKIPMMRIDDLNLITCDLIQLDIEGYEPFALRGAQRTLAICKPVLMIEDKGLTEFYGVERGWTERVPDYTVVGRVNRDVILVPKESLQ